MSYEELDRVSVMERVIEKRLTRYDLEVEKGRLRGRLVKEVAVHRKAS